MSIDEFVPVDLGFRVGDGLAGKNETTGTTPATDSPAASPSDKTGSAIVSVVVLSRDERELEDTLADLRVQCRAFDELVGRDGAAECVVVDASQGRLEDIHQRNLWVRWIDYVAPFGVAVTIAHQRNAGVQAAAGDIVAFCDSGGRPEGDWLISLVTPLLDAEHEVTCGPIRSTRDGVYGLINDLPDGTPVENVLTANLAFTRAAFNRVGGFDERYAYGSDVDFSYRLSDAGTPAVSVQGAVMAMDWGPSKLQRKRSWRYGRARVRLLRFHSWKRRVTQLKRYPELLAWPLWLVGVVPALLVSLRLRRAWPLVAWASALAVPVLKNRHESDVRAVIVDHTIQGAAALCELGSGVVGVAAPVLMAPQDPDPYQEYLRDALAENKVASGYLSGPTASKTINVALAPLMLVVARLQGVKVIHLHWTFGFVPSWARLVPGGRRAARAWFSVWLSTLRLVGLRLVWTAHNVVPHEAVFDDDLAARRRLVRAADAIIAHSSEAADDIAERFGARRVYVIAQGAVGVGVDELPSRPSARARIGVDPDARLVVAAGQVRPYKGYETLVDAVSEFSVDSLVVTRICGSVLDESYRVRLNDAVARARSKGADVALENRYLEESELNDLLAASDIMVFPFRSVTNSGSVQRAMRAGCVVVVPDLPALSDLPDSVWRYRARDGARGLSAVIAEALDEPASQRQARRVANAAWADGRSWSATAQATRAVYERVVKRGRR